MKDDNNKINVKMSTQNKTIEKEIDNGYVFVRGIRDSGRTLVNSIHNETLLELELRKINRKVGYPTLLKENGTVDGNPNRSVSLLVEGAKVFANVGYGMINPDLKTIKEISDYNFGSGYGKKNKTNYNFIDRSICELFSRQFVPVEIRLDRLKSRLRNGVSGFYSKTCNEVVLDIKSLDDIAFVFYNPGKNIFLKPLIRDLEVAFRILDAIYIRDEVRRQTGRDIPILECPSDKRYPFVRNFEDKDVCQLLKTALKNDINDVVNVFSSTDAKWFNSFYKYIQKDEELKGIIISNLYKFKVKPRISSYPGFNSSNLKDSTNVHTLIKSYGSEKEANINYISAIKKHLKLPHIEVESWGKHRFNSCSFAMITKDTCLHKGVEVRNFLEMIENINKTLSQEAFESLKEDIQDSFRRLPLEIGMICKAQDVKREDKGKNVDSKNLHLRMYKKPENVLEVAVAALRAYQQKDYLGLAPKELLVLMNDCLNNKRCNLTSEKREEYRNIMMDYRNNWYKDLELKDSFKNKKISLSCVVDTFNPLKLGTKINKHFEI